MITLGSFALLRPLWLLALPALLLLLRFTRQRDWLLGDWKSAIDPPLLDALLRRKGGAKQSPQHTEVYWSVALIALALSGPAIKSEGDAQFRNLDASLILLDVSRGENLPQAVAAAQLVLAESGARQTGLVLYAGDAYLASPLTEDVAALEALLFAVDARTVPDGGARPDRALALARRLLRDTSAFAGDVTLISDGEGVDPRAHEEAASLAAKGHTLHTLFIASRSVNAADSSRRAAMMALASEGGGLTGDSTRAGSVAAAIAGRRVEHVAQGARRALEWRDYGRWLLLLAAAPLLLCLRAAAS